MSTISGHITLSKLVSKVIEVQGKSGDMVKGIFIPIINNDLYYNAEKNQVELNIICRDMKAKPGSKDTHYIKQSIPKNKRLQMTKEQLYDMPFIGNLSVWDSESESQPELEEIIPIDETDLPF